MSKELFQKILKPKISCYIYLYVLSSLQISYFLTYIPLEHLSVSNISLSQTPLYFKHLSISNTSLSQTSLYLKHLSISNISLSRTSLYLKHRLFLSNFCLSRTFEHSLSRTSLCLIQLSISIQLSIFYVISVSNYDNTVGWLSIHNKHSSTKTLTITLPQHFFIP